MKNRNLDIRMILSRVLLICLAATAVLCVFKFSANATPPSGLSFTPVGRATLPAFNVKRKIKALDWELELEADQPIDIATQIVTFQPGGFSGWHTHPGPVFFTVRTGTLTVYEGNDPTCTPHLFPAGTGAVEAATSKHIHMVRNETDSVAEAFCDLHGPSGCYSPTDRSSRPG